MKQFVLLPNPTARISELAEFSGSDFKFSTEAHVEAEAPLRLVSER